MKLDYGIERIEIIYFGNPIIIEKEYEDIGVTSYSVEYKDSGISVDELPTIKEAKMFAYGVDSGIIANNPNIKGREYE